MADDAPCTFAPHRPIMRPCEDNRFTNKHGNILHVFKDGVALNPPVVIEVQAVPHYNTGWLETAELRRNALPGQYGHNDDSDGDFE